MLRFITGTIQHSTVFGLELILVDELVKREDGLDSFPFGQSQHGESGVVVVSLWLVLFEEFIAKSSQQACTH